MAAQIWQVHATLIAERASLVSASPLQSAGDPNLKPVSTPRLPPGSCLVGVWPCDCVQVLQQHLRLVAVGRESGFGPASLVLLPRQPAPWQSPPRLMASLRRCSGCPDVLERRHGNAGGRPVGWRNLGGPRVAASFALPALLKQAPAPANTPTAVGGCRCTALPGAGCSRRRAPPVTPPPPATSRPGRRVHAEV